MAHFELGYGMLVLSTVEVIGNDRLTTARAAFDRSRSLNPTNLGGWWGLIVVEEIEREHRAGDTGLSLAHAATQEMPEDSRVWVLLATALLSTGGLAQPTQVRGSLERAIQLDPENGEAWALLGDVLARTGSFLSAQEAYRRVIEIEPTSWLGRAAHLQLNRLRPPEPDDSGSASGVRLPAPPDEPPDPRSPSGARLPVPPFIPAFCRWPVLNDRVLFFESAW